MPGERGAAVDLGPARDAGANTLTLRVPLDLRPELLEDRGLLRPRPDDVHVADEHVEELRQLIQPVLAENAADRRDTTVVRLCPDLGGVARIDPHRPELVDPEQAPPVVDLTAGSRIPRGAVAPVEPHAQLRVEHGPR